MSEKIIPYGLNNDNKTCEVKKMFDNISDHYDFLNDILSLGFDRIWRNKSIKVLLSNGFLPHRVLDVATGTGDFAIHLYDKLNASCEIFGIDLSSHMLEIARLKSCKRKIAFYQADGEKIPFDDNYFNSLSCLYGLRNFDNPQKGLGEFYRVLQKSGRVVIVELSEPYNKFFKWLFNIYFTYFVPILGGSISGDKAAYNYLPKSVTVFPSRGNFVSMMENAGFKNCVYFNLFGGIATLYFAEKL